MDQSDYDALARNQWFGRWLNAAVALVIGVAGVVLVLVRPGRNPQLSFGLGIWFVVLSLAMGFWAWRGDWSVPSAERFARQQRRLNVMMLAIGGVELLVLSLALLGLVLPSLFGSYWREHQFLVLIASAGLLADVITRSVRYLAARQARDNVEPSA
jgi:multisubunit Na+/H+ antiporter MnhB subunit